MKVEKKGFSNEIHGKCTNGSDDKWCGKSFLQSFIHLKLFSERKLPAMGDVGGKPQQKVNVMEGFIDQTV